MFCIYNFGFRVLSEIWRTNHEKKVQITKDEPTQVEFVMNAGDQLLLGLDEQPLPGTLNLWVGDAACRASSCSKAQLGVKLPEEVSFV